VTDGAKSAAPSLVSLDLTVPTDERFLTTVQEITRRAAEYVGFHRADAERIGEAINGACDSLLRTASTPEYVSSISLSFSTAAERFEVRLRCHTSVVENRSISQDALEDGLRNGEGRRSSVDAMKRVMDRVEFGEEDGVAFCRLTRALPAES
jgi:hypothetical protein